MAFAHGADAPALDHAAIRAIISGILLAMFLAALDQTIVATALPTIGRELHDLEHLSWVVTAYLLTGTAVTPLYGKLSDIHGRRLVMLIAIGIFVLGSLACALASSMLVLILGRALQGLGGGGLISLAQTIIADVVAPKERARYMGLIASVFATSSILGPVLGGVLAEYGHWSLIFWINLPLGAAAWWMTHASLRRLPRHERPHRLDVLGALLIVAATIAFMLALNWGGTRYPWLSAPVGLLLLAAAVASGLFALRLATAAEPLLPVAVLLNPVVAMAILAASFAMGTFIGLSIMVPLYFQLVLGLTASGAGLALIPFAAGVMTGATLAGRLMMHLRHYRRPALIGLAVAILGLLLLALEAGRLGLLAVELVTAAVGMGVGTVLPVTTVAAQNAVALHELGTATGVLNFFRSLGGAIAVALFGAILLGGLGVEAGGLELVASLGAGAGPLVAPVFGHVFAVAALGLAIGAVALARMAERPLRTSVGPSHVTPE